MDNLENLKNEIKIPEEIDLAIKSGIEQGRKEKRTKMSFKIYKRTAAAAAILLIAGMTGVADPIIAKATPVLQSIFKFINYGNMGESFEKFEQFSTGVNKSAERNGIKITINEIVIDENILAITSTEEGENLKEDRGYSIDIKLNGKLVKSIRDKDKKVDNNRLMTVTTANIADLGLSDDVEVNMKIRSVGDVNGPWNFRFKVSKSDKPTNSKVVNLDKILKIPGSTLKYDNLVISPLGNTLSYSGIYDGKKEDMRNGIWDFMVTDEEGRTLQTTGADLFSDKEKYSGKIEILSDLSNVKSIAVVPVFKPLSVKSKNINNFEYSILQTTTGSTTNLSQEIITKSRPVSEKGKSDGYAFDNVIRVYNIDKAREFLTLDNLINKTIKVGSNNTVLIKNIEAGEKETKVTLKIEGNGAYPYRYINETVILDENYKDIGKEEGGDTAVLENADEGIVSIKLPPIDKTKKYKIALPITDEPQIEEKYKVSFGLTK